MSLSQSKTIYLAPFSFPCLIDNIGLKEQNGIALLIFQVSVQLQFLTISKSKMFGGHPNTSMTPYIEKIRYRTSV
jgi:hypothetical protein